jgi:gliding motility-associated-like protein/uncharacterized delta-60 repeat protein
MNRLFFLFFALTTAFSSLHSQAPFIEWQKCLGGGSGDYAHAIEPTADGGYIVAGYTESSDGDVSGNHGTQDLWVVKITATGTIQWQKCLGGISWEYGNAIHQTADGGYVVAGSALSADGDVTGSKGGMDYWLVKLSATGTTQWQKSFGGPRNEYCYDMQITPDGGYILAGHSESSSGDVSGNYGDRDFWVVKLTASGTMEWGKHLGGSLADEAYAVQVAKDGGYIVVGYTESNNGDVTGHHSKRDFWVVKLSSTGTLQWQKALGGAQFDEAWAVETTPDGSFIVAGYTASNDGDASGNHQALGGFSDFWMVKLSATGSLQWQKCLGGNFNEQAFALALTPDGGIVVAGSAESANGDATCNAGWTDYWVVKTNGSGMLEWQKSMGGGVRDEIYSVRIAPDGGCILAGLTSSPSISGYHPNTGNSAGDYWIIKLSASVVTSPTPQLTITTPWTDVCSGAPFVFTATAAFAGDAPVYQWQKNNTPVGTNSPTYSATNLNAGDVIRCTLTFTTDCGTVTRSVTSNAVTMQGGRNIDPEVVTTASALSICSGGSVTFTATNKSGNPNPSFQWTVNGAPVGTNSLTFTTSNLTNGAVVVCRMTVPQCGGGSTKDDSDPITITIKSALNPSITISTPSATVCQGSAVAFTARAVDGGSNPAYQWKVNGVGAGTNSSVFTTTALVDGDEVQCVLVPDPATGCGGSSSVASNTLKMKVIQAQPTSISITASDPEVCSGTPVRFTAVVENAGATPSYQWEVNGVKVGTNSPTYTDSTLKDGDPVVCILSAQNTPCALASVHTSNTITLTVKPAPVVTVRPADTTVMAGTKVQLAASVSGPLSSFAWTPAGSLTDPQTLTPFTAPLQASATYRFLAVADNGCTVSREAVIKVVTKLYMPSSFTPDGDGLNDVFRIPPGTSLQLKEFAVFDRWGNKVFQTKDAGKGWNGTYEGKALPTGIYVFTISGNDNSKTVFLKGTVLLMR